MTLLLLARCSAELKKDRLYPDGLRSEGVKPLMRRRRTARGVLTLPSCVLFRGVEDDQLDGSGSAVVDLIFSIANRDETFFSGMAAMSCL